MQRLALLLLPALAAAACDAAPSDADMTSEADTDIAAFDGDEPVGDDFEWDRGYGGQPGSIDPNLAEAGSCSIDPDAVMPGDETDAFVAVARDEIELKDGIVFSVDPAAPSTAVAAGTKIDCRCDGGCATPTNRCEMTALGEIALCFGLCSNGISSDGKPCGGCSFHYATSGGGGTTPTAPEPDDATPIVPMYPTNPTSFPTWPTNPWPLPTPSTPTPTQSGPAFP